MAVQTRDYAKPVEGCEVLEVSGKFVEFLGQRALVWSEPQIPEENFACFCCVFRDDGCRNGELDGHAMDDIVLDDDLDLEGFAGDDECLALPTF